MAAEGGVGGSPASYRRRRAGRQPPWARYSGALLTGVDLGMDARAAAADLLRALLQWRLWQDLVHGRDFRKTSQLDSDLVKKKYD
jgi:hypothetical protein